MALNENLPDGVYERDQISKDYYKVLIVGGRNAQSSEINEIQQIQDSQRNALISSLYPEGTIISGGFAYQDPDTNAIHMRETKIHLKEYIFVLPAINDLVPNEEPESTVGILLTENFIGPDSVFVKKNGTIKKLLDENNNPVEGDSDLLNPVEGTANFGTKGGIRIQYKAEWVSEPDPNMVAEDSNMYYYPLYSTVEGKVVVTQSRVSSEIYDTIARYDNDSNGSYVISGMNTYHAVDLADDDENYHICAISEGVAHVNGYEVVFSCAKPINIDKIGKGEDDSGTTDTFERISEPLSVNGPGFYETRHSPIASVSRILVTKQKIGLKYTHGGYIGSIDNLTVTDSNTQVTKLNSQDTSENKDSVLAITNVTRVYLTDSNNNVLTEYVKNRDFIVRGDRIDWSPSSEFEPAPGSTYCVSLEYFTTDLDYKISDDRTGIEILQSEEGSIVEYGTCTIDYSHYLRRIDSVVLYPDGSVSVLKGAPSESDPVPQSVSGGLVLSRVLVNFEKEPQFDNDSYKTVKKSEILELRSLISKLQSNLAQLDLKTDLTIRDSPSTKAGMFVDPFYDDDLRDQGQVNNAEIIDQILYPEREWEIYNVYSGKDILLPSSSVNYLVQKYRTKDRKINEFSTIPKDPIGTISISPSTYRWTAKFTTVANSVWQVFGTHKYGSIQKTTTSTKVTDTNQIFKVPQFSVKITGSNFNGGEIIDLKIDNVSVGNTTANSTGGFTATVSTPSSMKSGIKEVTAVGRTSKCKAITSLSTVPQISTRYVTTYYEVDPVGQTFLNENQCFVSSVSVMFSVKPANKDNITLCICETSSGYPDPTKIIGKKVLQGSSIAINKFVEFVFDSPVLLEANTYYAFILVSEEATSRVYCAELGARDKWNSAWMTKNVFASGTLVQASQLYTWSAVQAEDLTFIIKRCKFPSANEREITVGSINTGTKSLSQLYLLSDSEVFSRTSLDYKVILDGEAGSYTISEYTPLSLRSLYKGNIKLVATMSSSSTDGRLSPRILGDVQIAGCLPVYPSYYTSRAFSTDGRYLKVYVDINDDAVNMLKVRYIPDTSSASAEGNTTSITMTRTSSTSGDLIPNDIKIYNIISIKSKDDQSISYVEGTNFSLVNKNTIRWINDGPIVGSEYIISYRPEENISAGTKIELNSDNKFPTENLGDGWVTKVFYKDIGSIGLSNGKIRLEIEFNTPSDDPGYLIKLPACKNLRVLTSPAEF